jgi:hypothetical protein
MGLRGWKAWKGFRGAPVEYWRSPKRVIRTFGQGENQRNRQQWGNAEASARHQQMASNPDAVIVLKEEKVWSFAGCSPKLISLAFKRLGTLFMSFSGSFILGVFLLH